MTQFKQEDVEEAEVCGDVKPLLKWKVEVKEKGGLRLGVNARQVFEKMSMRSSDDWAARKAVAKALVKLAVVERDVLPEYKASCLKMFEAKRHDKVKVVREAMTLMVEAWREIPDEVSPLSESQSSSKGYHGKCGKRGGYMESLSAATSKLLS